MLHDGKFRVKLGLPDGNTFPTSPAPEEGDIFWRTDQEIAYMFYNGAWYNIHLSGELIEPFDGHLNNPAARAYHDVNQAAGNGVWTELDLNSERFDTDAIHDTVVNNSRLTCKTAGIYQISGTALIAANAVGIRGIRIFFNATTSIAEHHEHSPDAAISAALSISTLYELAVDDFVELGVFQNSGGALNVLVVGNYSPEFGMVRVG